MSATATPLQSCKITNYKKNKALRLGLAEGFKGRLFIYCNQVSHSERKPFIETLQCEEGTLKASWTTGLVPGLRQRDGRRN